MERADACTQMRHVALLATLLVVAAVAGASVAAAGAPASAHPRATPAAGQALAADGDRLALAVGPLRTNFTVSLRADGSARWTVATRLPLEDDADRAAFREYAESYERGDAGGPSVDPFRNAAAEAADATDREMAVGRVNRSSTLHDDSGVLRLRFTWTGFLASGDDGALVLGDAFRTPDDGTWFGSLAASQRLVIEPPENYEVSDVSQGFSYSISDRRIVAEGPQTFEPGDIEVAYDPGAAPGGVVPPGLLVGAGAVLLVLLAALAYRRGGVGSDGATVGGALAGAGSATDAPDGDREGTAGPDDPAPASGEGRSLASNGRGDGATGRSDGEAAVAGRPEEPDLELLSDEERVERLLEREGGRMRQANIVSETGWSDAKVSQLLSAMADEGRVEKLRLGRENLISLADDGEAAADSDPADDDRAGDDASRR